MWAFVSAVAVVFTSAIASGVSDREQTRVFLVDRKNSEFETLIIRTTNPLVDSRFKLVEGRYQLESVGEPQGGVEEKLIEATGKRLTEIACRDSDLFSVARTIENGDDLESLIFSERIKKSWLSASCSKRSDQISTGLARILRPDRKDKPSYLTCLDQYELGSLAALKVYGAFHSNLEIECDGIATPTASVIGLDDLEENERSKLAMDINSLGLDEPRFTDQLFERVLRSTNSQDKNIDQFLACCGQQSAGECKLKRNKSSEFGGIRSLAVVDQLVLAHPELGPVLKQNIVDKTDIACPTRKACDQEKLRESFRDFIKNDFLSLCSKELGGKVCHQKGELALATIKSKEFTEDFRRCLSKSLSICAFPGDSLKGIIASETQKPKNEQSNVSVQNTNSEIQYQPLRVENTQEARVAARKYAAPARILAGQWSGVIGETAHASTSSRKSSSSSSRSKSTISKSKASKISSRAVTLEVDNAGRCVWLPNGKCVTASIDSNLTNLQMNVVEETDVNVPKLGTIKGRARSNFVSPTENRYQDSGGSSETPGDSSSIQPKRASALRAADAEADSSPRPGAGRAVAAASAGSGSGAQARASSSSSSSRSLAQVELPPRDVGSMSALRKTLVEFDGDPVVILSQKWMQDGLQNLKLRIRYNGVDDDGAPKVYFFGPSKAMVTRSYQDLVRGRK